MCNIYFYLQYLETYTKHTQNSHKGRDGSENFPGVGSIPPLIIEGDYLEVYFHSDASNEDWGWKFNAKVEYKKYNTVYTTHWLVDVEKQLVHMASSFAFSFFTGDDWDTDYEALVSPWLDLGFFQESEGNFFTSSFFINVCI